MASTGVSAASSDLETLGIFYRDHLEESVLPFWLGAPSDLQRGGVFTCIENVSGRIVSDDKFVWSQGRFAWLMGHAARLAERGLLRVDPAGLLERARRTADFLSEHAYLEDGSCAYLLGADGRKKEFLPGKGHAISYFADCFVILGLSEVARASGERSYLERALAGYRNVRERLAAGNAPSEPYPLPPGCRAHARPMIMLNVAQELERSLKEFGDPREGELAADALAFMDEILGEFVRPDGLVQEVRCASGEGSLLTRHVTPGHAIESMWFVIEQAFTHGRSDAVAVAAQAMQSSFDAGWDGEHGGILRYLEVPGAGEGPAVPPAGAADGPFEELILSTWDSKIWWPHSEALYGSLLAHLVTGEQAFRDMHDRTFDYSFSTFPHPDPQVGEWIQIRDRQGRPSDRVVGLPVKDPYHLMRNLLLLVELLFEGVPARTTSA